MDPRAEVGASALLSNLGTTLEIAMKWSKPSFDDIRFGFEITMYIATR
jgi:coenzyme PQQ precursor peptide PqqA